MPINTKRRFKQVACCHDLGGLANGQYNMCSFICVSAILKLAGLSNKSPIELKNIAKQHSQNKQIYVDGPSSMGKKYECIFWKHRFNPTTGIIEKSEPLGIPRQSTKEFHLGWYKTGESIEHGLSVDNGHFVIVDVIEITNTASYYSGFKTKRWIEKGIEPKHHSYEHRLGDPEQFDLINCFPPSSIGSPHAGLECYDVEMKTALINSINDQKYDTAFTIQNSLDQNMEAAKQKLLNDSFNHDMEIAIQHSLEDFSKELTLEYLFKLAQNEINQIVNFLQGDIILIDDFQETDGNSSSWKDVNDEVEEFIRSIKNWQIS